MCYYPRFTKRPRVVREIVYVYFHGEKFIHGTAQVDEMEREGVDEKKGSFAQ